jgi:transposase
MPKRGQAVHVATTTRKYGDKVYTSHLLRRTYREDGKVKHETLGNLSHLPEPIIEMIRQALRGETFVPVGTVFQIERSLPHGNVAAILGTLRSLELDRIISTRRTRQRDLVVAMIADRLIDPQSKLATARGINDGTSSLGDALDLGNVDEDELYAAMDWVLTRQDHIERSLAKRHLTEGGLALIDVTSAHFEGRTCPLAAFGNAKGGKPGKLQVVFGLLCDAAGIPFGVDVFEGNTSDPMTLTPQLEKLRTRFGLTDLVVVGDRGLITTARIREDLSPHEGLSWITALRAPAIRKLVDTEAIQLSLFDTQDLAEVTAPDYPGERLIVCRNPLLAEERRRKRNELLAATERELEAIAEATRREKRPLRGKDQIGLRVGKLLNRYKMGKHFHLTIEEDRFSWERKETQINQEAALDGFYVLRTDVPAEKLSAEAAVSAYKNLSRVERAFRCLKGIDLLVRPINHRLADRVRAHIFLCMLAYYVEWHMRERLAPLLFEDDDREGAASRRTSVVAPAMRSESAERKTRSRRTVDGFAVHSFKGLLRHLATLCKNTVRAQLPVEVTFTQYSEPTELQKRAFELLDVKYRL